MYNWLWTKIFLYLWYDSKGIFSSVIKDITGSKSKTVPDHMETEDARESFKELETIFSTTNVPSHAQHTDNMAVDEEEVELDIGI